MFVAGFPMQTADVLGMQGGAELFGMPSAVPQKSGGGGGNLRADVGHLVGQRLQGRIKKFKESWGFVNSDSFAGDLFLHTRSNPSLTHVGTGDPILFDVAEDSNSAGNYHAVNAFVVKDELINLIGERIHGWVKSYRDNWGLLNSHRFDGDVFVGQKTNKHLPRLQEGEAVEFEIAPDDKGKNGFQALKVKTLGGGTATAAGADLLRSNPLLVQLAAQSGITLQQLQSLVPVSSNTVGASGKPRPEALVGRRCRGTIRSFKDDWGFVISDEFEGDIFLHKGSNPQVGSMQAGDVVIFTVDRQASGKAHATDVQTVGNPYAALEGQTCAGTVRSFEDTWGFVVSPQFEGDIFVGLKNNPHLEEPLKPGDKVAFVLQRSAKGKSQTGFEAAMVQVVGHDPSALLNLAAKTNKSSSNNTGARSRSPRPVVTQSATPMFATVNLSSLQTLLGSLGVGGGGVVAQTSRSRSSTPRPSSISGAAANGPAKLAGATVTGWVRSYKGEWGFVNSASFTGDLFFGSKSNTHLLREPKAGDQVQFQISIGPNSKPEAVGVTLLNP